MKLKENNNVETGILIKRDDDILDMKKCQMRHLNLGKLGIGKEAELAQFLKTFRSHTRIGK
jgi:hypothetical protein